MIRTFLLGVAAVTLIVTASGCGSGSRPIPSGSARTLTNLDSIGQLQSAFNNASGEPRLIVIVSPT